MKLLLRWAITAFALFCAAWLVPGITVDGSGWVLYAIMAAILGLVNACIRPLLKMLTCPLIVLTLGLFTLVINALTLWLSSSIAQSWFGVDYIISGFWSALWGALIVCVVSVVLSVFVQDDQKEKKRHQD